MRTRTKSFASSKTTVLNASLMWFSVGLTAMLSVAIIFGLIPQMQTISVNLFSSRAFVTLLSISAIGLMIAISFMFKSAKLETLVIMYVIFAIVEGFSLSMILINFTSRGESWKILALLLIPSTTMLIMGIMGYSQIFDFSKIGRFLMFSLIGLMVSGFIMIFIPSIGFLWKVYSIIGYGIFTLYIGFDFWRISRLDDMLNLSENPDKSIILRYGLMFGLSLLIDFIQLIWFLARLLLDR